MELELQTKIAGAKESQRLLDMEKKKSDELKAKLEAGEKRIITNTVNDKALLDKV